MLIPELENEARQVGVTYGGLIQQDGSYSIDGIPPGHYTLRARCESANGPQVGNQTVDLSPGAVVDVSVVLTPPLSVSGKLIWSGRARPDLTHMGVTVFSLEPQIGNRPRGGVDSQASFRIEGVPPGPSIIEVTGISGWMVVSIVIDGRDVTDTPIELMGGQRINAVITVTDRVTEISGIITTDRGDPFTDYTILAFSTDPSFWTPLSHRVAAVRPDQTGAFALRGLPAGDYYLTAKDSAGLGEWSQPRYLDRSVEGAIRVSLAQGETKTEHLTVRAQ
jgi:hypothetical protein